MRAPVYRNAEARSTLLGLSFPTEVLLVLAVFWASMLSLDPTLAALTTLTFYVALRVVSYGRAEAFVQHWVNWRLRQAVSGGRLSAAARCRTPRFPFGRYQSRDLRRDVPGVSR